MSERDDRPAHILIVEDEPDLVMSLEEDLRRQGYNTTVSVDGDEAVRRAREVPYDLILLDVMLPKLDGFDVCKQVRKAGVRTPIILLTARSHDAEKELGLDAGADDYVTKPFSPRELRARIRAHLRRASSAAERGRLYRFGDCQVDFDRAEVRKSGHTVMLTAQELRLLEVLVLSRGRVLSREQLIDAAWERGVAVTDRSVDTQVFNLRQKLEPVPGEPKFIIGVRGLGYRFEGAIEE